MLYGCPSIVDVYLSVSIDLYPQSMGVLGEDNHYNICCLFIAAEVMQDSATLQ